MNRYRKLYSFVKAVNHSIVSDTTRQAYSISHSIFSFRCHSNLVESQTSENTQFVENNSTSTSSELSVKQPKRRSVIEPTKVEDLSDYGSVLKPSFNFAAYADKSPLLQKLIELGVRLYEWEKNPETIEFILPLDFDKRVKPYLSFLTKHGVPIDKIGDFLTQNPFILKEDFDDLKVRIDYLKSKKFSKDMIASLITRNPKWLSIPVKQIDDRLGYLQQSFNLKGDDVRNIIMREPSLVKVPMRILRLNVLTLKEEMELEEQTVKKLVTLVPHLLRKNTHEYLSSYDYLRRVMKIPQSLIIKTPSILNLRKHKIAEKHKFLESLGKAQYNPLLPCYVPLSSFYELSDEEFCKTVAHASLDTFYKFLKTL